MSEDKQRYYVTLYLKYGHIISFTCTDFSANVNGFGSYTNVSWKGADIVLSFSLDHLIGYTADALKEDAK